MINKSIHMKNFEIKLDGKVEEIKLGKLTKPELEHMIKIALEFENYEMCSHLKKFINLLNYNNI